MAGARGDRIGLHRGDGPPLVIGHRGAAALAPENTLAALSAAVAAGADFVEFDVGAALVLGHSERETPEQPVSFDDALAFLGSHGVGAHVDLKSVGNEEEIVAAIRRHGLTGRVVISSVSAKSLRRLEAIAPELGRAITYPQDRHGISSVAWPGVLTRAGAGALRAVMPLRVPPLLRVARANALSLHQALASRATILAAHALGAPVLVWTVNEPEQVERLAAIGADAIISDNPQMVCQVLATLNTP
ncbi:MAG TPA: glycerophosphodiester phosphodiesterase [Gaiellaceae bacterium]|nr:glycerophosphodiester phosphodiesterase [Gaiellaceae bacterium]